MVQRKTCQATESYNLQPETRFGQEHLKNLGPEMMMMKRTKHRKKLQDNTVSSQSGKSPSTPKHGLVVKVAGGSPNYMKGTSSSEARKENKKRFNLSRNQKNQTGLKHDSRYGVNKERSHNKPSSRIGRGLTKAPSFKRCSQRATCSSTLKDSKFPEYLMLNHGETYDEVNGTSVLKVCPYTYCSLNGHHHSAQYPPLKSFISSRRQSLNSQKSVKLEAPKEEFVGMDLVEKKESEQGNGGACEVFIDTQISETASEGAPRSETDSEDYSDSAEMVRFLEGDHVIELKESGLVETLVHDSVKEIQEKDDAGEETLDDSNRDGNANQSGCFSSEAIGVTQNSEAEYEIQDKDDAGEETLEDKDDAGEKTLEDKDDAGEETLEDKAEDCKEESPDRIEVISMTEETAKIPFNRTGKLCNQEEPDATISWTINKGKKPIAETENLREFNPREPNYLPIVEEEDTEKVDLKHQDIDERRNSEDWMFDYALQRAVTKLAPAKKKKVALLVEAFETVQPVMSHGKEPAPVLSYGRHLQACN